jgi:hypothetical protein
MANPLLVNALSSSPRLLIYALLCVCVSLSFSLSGERRRAFNLPEIAIPRFYPKRAIASLQPRKKAHNENNTSPLKPCQRCSSQDTEIFFFFCWFLFIIIIFFLSFLYVKSFMMGAAAGVWGSVIMTTTTIFFFFTKKGRNLF